MIFLELPRYSFADQAMESSRQIDIVETLAVLLPNAEDILRRVLSIREQTVNCKRVERAVTVITAPLSTRIGWNLTGSCASICKVTAPGGAQGMLPAGM